MQEKNRDMFEKDMGVFSFYSLHMAADDFTDMQGGGNFFYARVPLQDGGLLTFLPEKSIQFTSSPICFMPCGI